MGISNSELQTKTAAQCNAETVVHKRCMQLYSHIITKYLLRLIDTVRGQVHPCILHHEYLVYTVNCGT